MAFKRERLQGTVRGNGAMRIAADALNGRRPDAPATKSFSDEEIKQAQVSFNEMIGNGSIKRIPLPIGGVDYLWHLGVGPDGRDEYADLDPKTGNVTGYPRPAFPDAVVEVMSRDQNLHQAPRSNGRK